MPTDYLLDPNILVHWIRNDALGRMIQAQYSLRAFVTKCMVFVVTVGEIETLASRFG